MMRDAKVIFGKGINYICKNQITLENSMIGRAGKQCLSYLLVKKILNERSKNFMGR